MKTITRILTVISAAVLICGCGEPQPQKAEVNFPENMVEELTEQIKVSAKFIYPESCKNGKGAEVQLGGKMFWDRQDEIAKLLIQDREIANEYIDDYGIEKFKTYEVTENNTILVISNNNYLNYATNQSAYINNVLFSDVRFDDYNGNRYQDKTDLAFMPQKEAWEKVCGVLDELGVEISEDVTCYVMEHAVMREEEAAAIARAEEEDTKIPTAKTQWTEEDDCYYFTVRTAWQGYPVLPPVMGEGFDENNVSAIYDKNGIQSLIINGYYPLELKNEIELQSPTAAIRELEEYIGNIITNDIYEVQKVTLCQKVLLLNPEKQSADIEPVWECSVLVKSGDSPEDSYLQKIYFHAGTLKVI